jgi:formylmethanofuran dehydrogenase subunit B
LGGKITCTLGEVKNRADFIIYWGGNPAECHPRHFTKYTLTQKGKFVPEGRKGRYMVLVDIRETPSAKAADLFLQIRPGKDFEVLTTLRALVKDQDVNAESVAETGLSVGQLRELVNRMKRAKFGVIFFGMGLSMTRGKHMNSAGVLNLAAELNAFTKFVCMPMRGHGNVTGSDMVLRWSTGYPFGVSMSRGYPRFNPGEFSTVDLIVRGDNDAALILGADPGATMPQPGIDHLARARSESYAHEPSRSRAHHDGGHGSERARHCLSHGRDPLAAAASPQVAVPHGRRGCPAHSSGCGDQTHLGSDQRQDGTLLSAGV